MSAALRHHKQRLHLSYPLPQSNGMNPSSSMNHHHRNNNNNNNNSSNNGDNSCNDDDHTNASSHCSLSDEPNHPTMLSEMQPFQNSRMSQQQQPHPSATLLQQQQQQQQQQHESSQYPIGTQCKKYFHGHGWCTGEIITFSKGRYKVRFERPNLTTGTTTQKEIYYTIDELPRLMKTTSVIPGTRVEIFWPHEKKYYIATIKTELPRKRENYLICYDNSSSRTSSSSLLLSKTTDRREWIDLHRHKFRIIAQPPPPPPPSDEYTVVALQPVPSTTSSSSNDNNILNATHESTAPAVPQSNDHTPPVHELGHPTEVMIQKYHELDSNESGSISMETIATTLPAATTRTVSDESSQFLHLVSSVPSSTHPKQQNVEDTAMDTSHGGTITSIDPPRTIVSMEMEEDSRKFDSMDGMITHPLPSLNENDFCSPGSSSTSTNRSVVLRVVPEGGENVNDILGFGDRSHIESVPNVISNSLQHADDQYSLRRVSQETINDTDIKDTQPTEMVHESSSSINISYNDTMDVEVNPRSKSKSISTSILESDDNAEVKTSMNDNNTAHHNNDNDEECILIDPDKDEATKTAVYSLIQIGSRVSVYSEYEDQFFPGTVTDRKYRGKPFYIEYDDDEAEWIDLRKTRFRLLPSLSSTTALPSSLSSSLVVAQDDCTALGAVGYRSTRRSNNVNIPIEGKFIHSNSTAADTARNRGGITNTKSTLQPEKTTILKRSERTTTKPTRFQDLCDTTDSEGEMKDNKTIRRKKLSTDIKLNQVDNDVDKITIGTRVAVWWSGDKQYYNAVVTDQRSYKKPFLIEYEETEEREWIDFKKNKFQILPPTNAKVLKQEMDDNKTALVNAPMKDHSPNRFRLGSPEVTKSMHQNHEADISPGTNTKKRKSDAVEENNLPDSIVSVDLVESFNNDSKMDDMYNKITVGSRVSVYWEGDDKYFYGTVTDERETSEKKHYLEYDDGEAAHWIDFRDHWFKLLDGPFTKKKKVKVDIETTLPKSSGLSPDKKAKAHTKNVSKQQLTKVGSSDNIDTKRSSYSKVKTAGTKGYVEKVSTNGNTAVSIKQKVEKIITKASTETKENTDWMKVYVGARVEVWWEGDSRYYKGTVLKLGVMKNKKHYIRYDDDEEEWVYFAKNRVRLLNGTGIEVATKASKVAAKNDDKILSKAAGIASTKARNGPVVVAKKTTTIDTRIKYDLNSKIAAKGAAKKDKDSSARTKKGVTKKANEESVVGRRTSKETRCIEPAAKKIESESDDSDASSTCTDDHYAYDDFVYGNVEKLKVGSRVSVWWTSYRRYFDGTIKQIDNSAGCRRPYYIKYDDNDKEWTDLRRRYFRFLD